MLHLWVPQYILDVIKFEPLVNEEIYWNSTKEGKKSESKTKDISTLLFKIRIPNVLLH